MRKFKFSNLIDLNEFCHDFEGLTYTQICNWFANWRRKLKNTSNQKKSWGNLIKNYNFSARGNVEQFSISSGDSIWEEQLRGMDSLGSSTFDESEAHEFSTSDEQKFNGMETMAHGQTMNGNFMLTESPFFQNAKFMAQSQCFQISSTTNEMASFHVNDQKQQFFSNSTKFKNHIMEKYLRGLDEASNSDNNNCETVVNNNIDLKDIETDPNKKPELSKWLESTANFTPSDYNIDFMRNDKRVMKREGNKHSSNVTSLCEKELLAAETLVLLKNNFRTKFYNS
jgi:hypothetical protein